MLIFSSIVCCTFNRYSCRGKYHIVPLLYVVITFYCSYLVHLLFDTIFLTTCSIFQFWYHSCYIDGNVILICFLLMIVYSDISLCWWYLLVHYGICCYDLLCGDVGNCMFDVVDDDAGHAMMPLIHLMVFCPLEGDRYCEDDDDADEWCYSRWCALRYSLHSLFIVVDVLYIVCCGVYCSCCVYLLFRKCRYLMMICCCVRWWRNLLILHSCSLPRYWPVLWPAVLFITMLFYNDIQYNLYSDVINYGGDFVVLLWCVVVMILRAVACLHLGIVKCDMKVLLMK